MSDNREIITLTDGRYVSVEAYAEHTFRVRMSAAPDFEEPLMVRYGILQPPATADFDLARRDADATTVLSTPAAALHVDRRDGRVTLFDEENRELLQQVEPPRSSHEHGFRAAFSLNENERIYGLGDETRDRLEKRGRFADMWVRNVASYAPLSNLMSTRGYGLIVNSTRRHYLDAGHERSDRLAVGAWRGELDYFIVAGETLPALLNRITAVTGKPTLLPLWGYGLTFVCHTQANARDVLEDAANFRRHEIPCDLIGLEPGWMETHYDTSVDKTWSRDRFWMPRWMKGERKWDTWVGGLKHMGFKLSLWLCCEYDLTAAEEDDAGDDRDEATDWHPDAVELDEHIAHPSRYMDTITKPDSPWFDHLKPFVDQGADAFKMDAAFQVNNHPDRLYRNGRTDADMHNLNLTLLNKQMSEGFRDHTGRRAMIYSSGAYLGIQQYASTWAGDTGGGPKPLTSILNHGLSGHSNASCDMDVQTAGGIHAGFLMPWSQINSWASWKQPWYQTPLRHAMLRDYARLRYRLLPYIYSCAHEANRTGMPVMRAMPLAYPEDPRSDQLLQQYLFGPFFLTCAFADALYLPAGTWTDYWTGRTVHGPADWTEAPPENRGGPLFVKAGAIIPMAPVMQYVGEKQWNPITLDIFPGEESAFTLFEDDGATFAFRDGEIAETRMWCKASENEISLDISPRSGRYGGMPSERTYELIVHLDREPAGATCNDRPLQNASFDSQAGVFRASVTEDKERRAPCRVRIALPVRS